MSNESIWKRLTRLFRSGPVVRHKIQAGEKLFEPQGTASAYKRDVSSIYVHSLASYGQYERLARYADYAEMMYMPEIASALDIVADEVTCEGEDGHVVKVQSKNDEIKQILETLFFDIIDVDYRLWGIVRTLCKNGDYIMMVDASDSNGILNLLPIPINEIEREEGYDKDDPFATRFRWTTHGNTILQNWQMIHFRLLGDDQFLPYGVSYLEPARRIWRQLILIEDAMLVYRIVRSPERRVFKIDVGNLPPNDIDAHMEMVKNNLRRNQIIDSTTGRVDLRYNAMSVDEDIWIPKRGIQDGTQIDTLPGGQFTGDIEDVQYIQSKLFAALKIPKAYLGYEAELGSKATLAQEDVRFAKTIERIQKLVVAELNKIAIIHLFLMGYDGEDLVDFEISMASPSTVATQQRLELWRMKLEIAGMAGEGVLNKDTIYTDILGFNEAKIAKIKEGRKADKLEDSLIEKMGTEEPAAGGDLGGEEPPAEGGGLPGEEELPTTLGGPENAGFSLQGMVLGEEDEIEELRNPGSEGDDAFISTDKGKDLFSTGEDQFNLVFGTEKQTASDPYDQRAFSRLISRPFSEDFEQELEEEDIFDEMLEELEESQEFVEQQDIQLKKS